MDVSTSYIGEDGSLSWIINAIAPIACKYRLKRVFLFGSHAKGTANDESDVDLLVEKGEPMSLIKFSGLRQDCVESLGCEVDLITTPVHVFTPPSWGWQSMMPPTTHSIFPC